MVSKPSRSRKFNGMSYGEIQRINSKNRSRLTPEDQQWLKDNGYKNAGWDQVIHLYQKIEEFLDSYRFKEMTLEELFLEADRIGNKYLTPQEIAEFNQKMSQEVAEIGALIDQQFPDHETEIIDYSKQTAPKPLRKRNQKTYRTAKL